ncbi:MAG: hypothetical protein DHS20C21_07260 [Gemmatimonadota bacterium]|nr:MAG: hypothetical protein DHS20C21_07260 [Gemmatimonadota bacterium]
MKRKRGRLNLTRTPEDARSWLQHLWHSGELNWFLGAQPQGFDAWTAKRTKNRYVFNPDDGGRCIEFDREVLDELIPRMYVRLNRSTRLLSGTPESSLRAELTKTANRRLSHLLKSPFWREAADYGGEFFYMICPQAIHERGVAERWRELDNHFRKGSVSLHRIAEFVTRNYTDVWLCFVLQRALDEGGVSWRRSFNMKRYGNATDRLLETDSPYSQELKNLLTEEREQLRQLESRDSFGQGFRKRKAALQQRFFGNPNDEFFGRKLRHQHEHSKQQWPYSRQEIVNVVGHLKAQAPTTVTGVYGATGELLSLIAPAWFVRTDATYIGKKFRDAVSRPTAKGGPSVPSPIPELGEPPWQSNSFVTLPR